ncbi:MAG: metal-dependent hydrolase [Planctomycetes bacterium]|nr:metal-dependent hydrolase [Planctomycetota bacterium]
MADFKTHIATSSALGLVYAGAGHALGIPLTSSLIAGGLCGLAGMLPDLDSDSGIPVRETASFTAALAPVLMMERFEHLGLSREEMVLAFGGSYLAIRFGLAEIFKRYTVHRGMWHSLPAALIVAVIGYLLCGCHDPLIRFYKAGALFVGFVSHLWLDELHSVQVRRGKLRVKKSLGTAMKLWGDNSWANFSTYAKLVVLVFLAFGDTRYFTRYFGEYEHRIEHTAGRALRDVLEQGREFLR